MGVAKILKDGDEVAEARFFARLVLGKTAEGTQRWPGVDELDCYYFPKLNLSPPATFRHLAGMALTGFLDNTSLMIGKNILGPMRYVHGRSEVMKGSHTVSAVLLVKVTGSVDPGLWTTYLPDIYRCFTATWQPGQENA
jgi:hypothetical protein